MKLRLAVVTSLALAAPLGARQSQQPPVFRGGVNIVTLDVTAVDKDGKPVRDLTAADFVVTLEGQQRPVQTVDFIEFGSGTSRAVTSASTAASSPAAPAPARAPAHERRAVVLLFDDLSFKAGDGKGLAVAAQRTIAQFGPDDLIGVAVTSALVPPVNPTTDRVALQNAVKKLVGRADDVTYPFFISAREADEIDRDFPHGTLGSVSPRECSATGQNDEGCPLRVRMSAKALASELKRRAEMQIEAYRQSIAAVKPFDGAKVVITLTQGVASNMELELFQRRLDTIMKVAAESGVRFYALTEEPDYSDITIVGMPSGKARAGDKDRNGARIENARVLYDGIASVAIAAGGEAFHVIGQADRFFKRIETETSAIYRLGIDAPIGADKTRFLDAKVKVNRPGVTVRANRKVLSANAPPEQPDAEPATVDQRLRSAISEGGNDQTVPVTVSAALLPDDGAGQRRVGVTVQIPASVAGPVTVMFSLIDEAGKSVQAGRKELSTPVAGDNYRFQFALPIAVPGRYKLRVAAADADGRIGRTEQEVGRRFYALTATAAGRSTSSLIR
jgi:VWFA-related protein